MSPIQSSFDDLPKKRWQGFTLLELLVSIGIVGVLSVFAVVSYEAYIQRAYRDDAMRALEANAGILEQNRMRTGSYSLDPQAQAQLIRRIPEDAPDGEQRYNVTSVVNPNTPQVYVLTATPVVAEANSPCGSLTLNHIGVRSSSKTENLASGCW